MTDLQHSTREEPNSRCNVCTLGLSWIENYLYGNRCALCADNPKRIGIWATLSLVYMDWLIYKQTLRLRNNPDALMDLKGAMGELGYFDPNQIRSVSEKARFLRTLKRVKIRSKF